VAVVTYKWLTELVAEMTVDLLDVVMLLELSHTFPFVSLWSDSGYRGWYSTVNTEPSIKAWPIARPWCVRNVCVWMLRCTVQGTGMWCVLRVLCCIFTVPSIDYFVSPGVDLLHTTPNSYQAAHVLPANVFEQKPNVSSAPYWNSGLTWCQCQCQFI